MLSAEQRKQLYSQAQTRNPNAFTPPDTDSASYKAKQLGVRALGGVLKVVDQIQRPYYGLMNVGKDIADKGDFTPWKSFTKGVTLQEKTEFSDVTTELGWRPESTSGKVFKGVVDFAGAVAFDPTSWFSPLSAGKGVFKVGAKGAMKTITREGTEALMKKVAKETGESVTRRTLSKVMSKMSRESYDKIVGEILEMGIKNPEKFFAKKAFHITDPFTSGKLFDIEVPGSRKLYKNLNKLSESVLDIPMIRRPGKKAAKTLGNWLVPNYSIIKSKNLSETDKFVLLRQISRISQAKTISQTENIASAIDRFGDFDKAQRESITFELEKFLKATQKGSDYSLDSIKNKNIRTVVGELRGEVKNIFDSEVALGLRNGAKEIEDGYVKRILVGTQPTSGSKIARKKGVGTVEDSINAYKAGKADWYFEPDVAKWWAARTTESDFLKIKKENIDWLVNNKIAKDASKLSTDDLIREGLEKFSFAGKEYATVPEVIKELKLTNFTDKISQEATSHFLRLYDNAMNLWKLEHTSLFPAFHARNLTSNMYLMFLGGWSNPRYLKNAFSIQRYGKAIRDGKTPLDKVIKVGSSKWKLSEIYDLAYKNGVIGQGQLGADFLQKVRIRPKARDFFKGDKATEKAKSLMGESFATAEMIGNSAREIGSSIENNARLTLFIDQLAKGNPAEEAAVHVKKFLFDYGELTDTERNVLKRIVPFYTWMRKNIPLQLEQLAKQPGKYTGVAHLQGSIEQFSSDRNEKYLPDYMKSGEMRIRLPNGKYITPDLPFQDLSGFMGASKILSSTNPVIQGFVEWVTNKDVFSGRELADERLPEGQFEKAKVKAMLLDQFRTTQLWRKAEKEDRTTLEYWLDTMLGINITPIDVAKGKKYYKYDKALEKSALKKQKTAQIEAKKKRTKILDVISPFK